MASTVFNILSTVLILGSSALVFAMTDDLGFEVSRIAQKTQQNSGKVPHQPFFLLLSITSLNLQKLAKSLYIQINVLMLCTDLNKAQLESDKDSVNEHTRNSNLAEWNKPFVQLCTSVYDGENCEEDSLNPEIIWTVVQRRFPSENNVNFTRNWRDYKTGFGSYSGEFYIGNEKLHRFTQLDVILRIEFYTDDGRFFWAQYDTFLVGSEQEFFKLTVSDYTGNSTNTFDYHNGMSFSTYDQDHDKSDSRKCAEEYQSGFWFRRYVWLHAHETFC